VLPEELAHLFADQKGSALKTSFSLRMRPSQELVDEIGEHAARSLVQQHADSIVDMRSSSRWRYLGEIFSNHWLHLAS